MHVFWVCGVEETSEGRCCICLHFEFQNSQLELISAKDPDYTFNSLKVHGEFDVSASFMLFSPFRENFLRMEAD